MSRVNVDAQAYLDSRFGVLGSLMGWGRAEFAIGMMSRIWLECTLRETDILSEAELGFAWGCDGYEAWAALRDSKLGDVKPMAGEMRMMRIKGCKGRTDWLAAKRKAGKKGGKVSKETKEAKDDSAYGDPEADPKQESNTPAPAPAPAPAQKENSKRSEVGTSDPTDSPDLIPDPKAATISENSLKAADYLREKIIERTPECKASRLKWDKHREKWAGALDKLNRIDGAKWGDIRSAIDWLHDTENMFVVQSAEALRKKWDSIQANKRHSEPEKTSRLTAAQQLELASEGEDEVYEL